MGNKRQETRDKRQGIRYKGQWLGGFCLSLVFLSLNTFAATDADMEDLSAASILAYEPAGSLFQQITDLEQEKILMQLEKEAAQLDLELDRLAAEKIKLSLEIDTLVGRSEEQQLALEAERERLEAEAVKLERERNNAASTASSARTATAAPEPTNAPGADEIGQIYKLVDIVGRGSQLEATLEYLSTGQRRKVSVGQEIEDGDFTVKSISLADGVVFDKDGVNHRLNIATK